MITSKPIKNNLSAHKLVSILVPCYNEGGTLYLFYEGLIQVVDTLTDRYDFELIFVNDGSTDNTMEVLRDLRQKDNRVNYLELSRNFGKEISMLAALDYASGHCIINLDADLQDPPSAIPLMLQKWEQGYMDVYGRRRNRMQPFVKKNASKLFHKLMNRLASVEMQENAGDFRLLDRRCADALRSMRESQRYTKGLYSWIGFNKTCIDINVAPRVAGKSKWTFSSLTRLAIDGITSHSLIPLRIASVVGLIVSFVAFIFLIWVVLKALICGDKVAGYPSLMAVNLFLGGTILLALGIIGEYVGRVFMETKCRPPYFINSINDEIPDTDSHHYGH